jgi:two-component system response regulator
MLRTRGRPVEILLVEDDAGQAERISDVFRTSGVPCAVTVVDNGDGALAWVGGAAGRSGRPRPDLIVLDLNMPTQPDGRAVLEALKKDPASHRVPVVVLTASASASDVEACYRRDANAYVVKPRDPAEFDKAMKALAVFWLEVVTLVPR